MEEPPDLEDRLDIVSMPQVINGSDSIDHVSVDAFVVATGGCALRSPCCFGYIVVVMITTSDSGVCVVKYKVFPSSKVTLLWSQYIKP